jgi:hypothetical protein
MVELADIFRVSAMAYLKKYGPRMLPSHKRAIRDITLCRTEALGGNVYLCRQCEAYRYSYHSCNNRHCPKCGNDAATVWLTAQNARLLPVKYFLVTVTLPAQLRKLARQNQKRFYSLMMRCAGQALLKLAKDPKWIGGEVGIIAVLQTWARDMHYHPHAHFIVTAGGVSADGQKWRPAQRAYLMPQKAVAKIFRAKFRDALKKEAPQLFNQVSPETWRTPWVVDIRPAGKGQTALKYLAPYIFRVAISNKRLVGFNAGCVSYRYQDNKDAWHLKTMTAEAFMSCFLQHVLPKRFVKVRYYGFFSPRQRDRLETIKALFDSTPAEEHRPGESALAGDHEVLRCPKCGSPLLFVREILPQPYASWSNAVRAP